MTTKKGMDEKLKMPCDAVCLVEMNTSREGGK